MKRLFSVIVILRGLYTKVPNFLAHIRLTSELEICSL